MFCSHCPRPVTEIFYKKSKGVLLEIILGNIKKEKLNLKELAKGD